MRRVLIVATLLSLLLAGFSPVATAAPQILPELSYKFYPLKDVVFVDFHNPYFAPIDNIVINMVIRGGTGRNRVIAIGQARMPANLILMPGEHTSARVPIRARVMRDIPPLAQFEFRIIGRQLDSTDGPPDVVVQDSENGISLELNRDANNVPFVMGFITLNPSITTDTTAQVEMAILTFYDENHNVVWSEIMPINGKLKSNDSLMLWGKYEQVGIYLVPDITSVETKFVVAKGN